MPGPVQRHADDGSHFGLMSAAVNTTATPGAPLAAATSTEAILACGCGLRTKQACSMRGSAMSSM